MKWAIRWAVLGAILALVPMAKADSTALSFVLSGPTTASFDLPETPTVLASLNDFGFMVEPTDLMVNGSAATDLLFFYSANPVVDGMPIPGIAGGVAGLLSFPNLAGVQLYSGSESAPTFLTGTFSLTNFDTGSGSYTLKISPVDGPPVSTPEPATLALTGLGLLGLAIAVNVKRRSMPDTA